MQDEQIAAFNEEALQLPVSSQYREIVKYYSKVSSKY